MTGKQSSLKIPITFHTYKSSFVLVLFIVLIPDMYPIPTCEINPNCFEGCSDSICVYDPTTNPFYNSSIILANLTTYNGPYCCSGCNLGYFLWDDNITCNSICNVISAKQQYGNPLTRKCVSQCPSLYYGDPTTTNCVTKCPEGYWVSLDLGLCVAKCPQTTNYYFLQNRTCLNVCPSGNYTYSNKNNQTICSSTCLPGSFQYDIYMTCVTLCPNLYYGDSNTSKCVQSCSSGTYKQQEQKMCVSECTGLDRYGDDSTGNCVQKCPYSQTQKKQYYGDNMTSKCISQCPSGSYAHIKILICVSQCFTPYPLANSATNTCELPSLKESLSPRQIAIISSTIIGGIIFLSIISILVYKFYIKKRLIRKPWMYNVLDDLNFTF